MVLVRAACSKSPTASDPNKKNPLAMLTSNNLSASHTTPTKKRDPKDHRAQFSVGFSGAFASTPSPSKPASSQQPTPTERSHLIGRNDPESQLDANGSGGDAGRKRLIASKRFWAWLAAGAIALAVVITGAVFLATDSECRLFSAVCCCLALTVDPSC